VLNGTPRTPLELLPKQGLLPYFVYSFLLKVRGCACGHERATSADVPKSFPLALWKPSVSPFDTAGRALGVALQVQESRPVTPRSSEPSVRTHGICSTERIKGLSARPLETFGVAFLHGGLSAGGGTGSTGKSSGHTAFVQTFGSYARYAQPYNPVHPSCHPQSFPPACFQGDRKTFCRPFVCAYVNVINIPSELNKPHANLLTHQMRTCKYVKLLRQALFLACAQVAQGAQCSLAGWTGLSDQAHHMYARP
jgi:hypothetical protein